MLSNVDDDERVRAEWHGLDELDGPCWNSRVFQVRRFQRPLDSFNRFFEVLFQKLHHLSHIL